MSKGTLLGSVHSLGAVLPLPSEVSEKVTVPVCKPVSAGVNNLCVEEEMHKLKFDLKHLSEVQQKALKKVQMEERVFSKNDTDIRGGGASSWSRTP